MADFARLERIHNIYKWFTTHAPDNNSYIGAGVLMNSNIHSLLIMLKTVNPGTESLGNNTLNNGHNNHIFRYSKCRWVF